MSAKQTWQCPKCGLIQTAPVPAIEVACGKHQKERGPAPRMVLIEGEPYRPPVRKR